MVFLSPPPSPHLSVVGYGIKGNKGEAGEEAKEVYSESSM